MCPNCGYCDKCGRCGPPRGFNPYPYNPYLYWWVSNQGSSGVTSPTSQGVVTNDVKQSPSQMSNGQFQDMVTRMNLMNVTGANG